MRVLSIIAKLLIIAIIAFILAYMSVTAVDQIVNYQGNSSR